MQPGRHPLHTQESLRRLCAAVGCCTGLAIVLPKQAHSAAGLALAAHHLDHMIQRVLTMHLQANDNILAFRCPNEMACAPSAERSAVQVWLYSLPAHAACHAQTPPAERSKLTNIRPSGSHF